MSTGAQTSEYLFELDLVSPIRAQNTLLNSLGASVDDRTTWLEANFPWASDAAKRQWAYDGAIANVDPLEDQQVRTAILDLYQRLAPKERFSFNAMLNRDNQSRAEIQSFFVNLTGDPNVLIGEGGFVDAYDAGGINQSLREDEFHSFRRQAFHDIRHGKASRIASVRDRVMSFVNSLRFMRPASSLGQKCGMDRPDSIAVDLKGNVLTCQNVSAAALAPNGESHRIGHTSQLDQVALKTATHWSHRSECPKCPVLQICKGSCMFLEGPLWEASCNNAYGSSARLD